MYGEVWQGGSEQQGKRRQEGFWVAGAGCRKRHLQDAPLAANKTIKPSPLSLQGRRLAWKGVRKTSGAGMNSTSHCDVRLGSGHKSTDELCAAMLPSQVPQATTAAAGKGPQYRIVFAASVEKITKGLTSRRPQSVAQMPPSLQHRGRGNPAQLVGARQRQLLQTNGSFRAAARCCAQACQQSLQWCTTRPHLWTPCQPPPSSVA